MFTPHENAWPLLWPGQINHSYFSYSYTNPHFSYKREWWKLSKRIVLLSISWPTSLCLFLNYATVLFHSAGQKVFKTATMQNAISIWEECSYTFQNRVECFTQWSDSRLSSEMLGVPSRLCYVINPINQPWSPGVSETDWMLSLDRNLGPRVKTRWHK